MGTREKSPDGNQWLVAAGAFVVAGIACAVAMAVGGAIVLGALFGALFLVVAVVLWSRAYPKNSKLFTVRPAAPSVLRGDTIEVFVDVDPKTPRNRPVEVGLVCTEYTKHVDNDRDDLVEHVAHEEWIRFNRSRGAEPVAFSVPADAPYSYAGKAVIADWRVVARQSRKASRAPLEVRP